MPGGGEGESMRFVYERVKHALDSGGDSVEELARQAAVLTGLKAETMAKHYRGSLPATDDDITAISAVLDITEEEAFLLTDGWKPPALVHLDKKRLEKAMKESRMWHGELADKAGVSRSTVYAATHGSRTRLEMALKICMALGMGLRELAPECGCPVGWTPDPARHPGTPGPEKPRAAVPGKKNERPAPAPASEAPVTLQAGATAKAPGAGRMPELEPVEGMTDALEVLCTVNRNIGAAMGAMAASQERLAAEASERSVAAARELGEKVSETSPALEALASRMQAMADGMAALAAACGRQAQAPAAPESEPALPAELERYAYSPDDGLEEYKRKAEGLVRRISAMTGLISRQVLHDCYKYMNAVYGTNTSELRKGLRELDGGKKCGGIEMMYRDPRPDTRAVFINTLATWASRPAEDYFASRYDACKRLRTRATK